MLLFEEILKQSQVNILPFVYHCSNELNHVNPHNGCQIYVCALLLIFNVSMTQSVPCLILHLIQCVVQ